MKKTAIVWGVMALGAVLIGGQVAAQACDGKGDRGPAPTTPIPYPEPPSGE